MDLFTETKQLLSLKTKLGQLLDSLNEILNQSLVQDDFTHLLSRLTVLTVQYQSLLLEVENVLFKQSLVHPHTCPISDPDFLPRVLLRTKLIPDLESYQSQRLLEYNQGLKDQEEQISEDEKSKRLYKLQVECEKRDEWIKEFTDSILVDELQFVHDKKSKDGDDDLKKWLNKVMEMESSGFSRFI